MDKKPLLIYCSECEAELSGNYCQACGTKRLDPHDLALKHFLHQAVHELTHLDSKIFRTLRVLLFRPGLLTGEYLAGIRRRYVSPLRLYLVIFAIYLFIYSSLSQAAFYDIRFLEKNNRSEVITRLLDKIGKKKSLTHERVVERINARWHTCASLAEFVDVIGLAFFLALVYWNRKRYFVEHLIFSLHFLSFILLTGIIAWPLLAAFGTGYIGKSMILPVVSSALDLFYLFVALQRIYGGYPGKTALRTFLLFLALLVTRTFTIVTTLVLAILMVIRYG